MILVIVAFKLSEHRVHVYMSALFAGIAGKTAAWKVWMHCAVQQHVGVQLVQHVTANAAVADLTMHRHMRILSTFIVLPRPVGTAG